MNGNATAVSSVLLSRRDNIHDAESESESSSAASSSKESYLESSVLLKDSSVTDLYHRKYSNNSSASYQASSHHLVREIYDPYLIQKGSSDRMHEVPLVQSTPSDDRITGKFTINRTGSKIDRVKQSKMHTKKTTGDSRMSIKEAPLERQHQGVPLGDCDIIDYNDDSNSMAVELSSVDSCAVNDFKGCDISMSQQKVDPGSINITNMMQDRSISNTFQLSSSNSFVSTELVSEITPDHVHRSTLSIIPATTTTSAVLSTSAGNARWDIALDSPFISAYAMNSYAMGINNKRETSSTPPLSLVPAPALFIAPSTLHRDAASSSSSLKGTQFMPLADASRASDWLQRSNQQQDQLIGGGFGRTMSNNGASHHGSSYHHHHHHHHVSNTSAIDSIFGLSASNVSKNCGPRDCADSDHSVATSLFVEVASLDEHGSYTRYGAACEEDPDEATEGEQDLVRSWAQLGYDSDLTMRSYPHSVTYQSRKQRKYGSTSNEKMSPTDPDNSHELEEPSSVINEEEDRLNNAPNQNRKLRHRLRSIKPSSKEITVRGKRKRRSGFCTLTVAAAAGGGGGGGGGAPLNTANSTRSSKYRSMVDSELLIGVRKSVEFGPGSNEEQYRYIDCGGGSTSTSMDAVDVEDGYDGASERGRCEYETDYPVDDDMGSASDNELPLDADAAVIDIALDNNNEGNNSLSDGLYLHSFDMPDSVYAFSINNNNNNNSSSSNSNESSIRNPSGSCSIVSKHAGKKRK